MDVSDIIDPLNAAQREAVAAPTGNILVLAGAGSGKTRVLVHRIAWYVRTGETTPHGILAVTFTNKAAGEMRARTEQLLGIPAGGMWVGTFHGIAHRLLRAHYQDANLPQDFQILDSDDQLRAIKRVLRGLNLDESQWPPREAQWFINARKEEGLRPSHINDHGDPNQMQMVRIYQAYQQTCDRGGLVDFAELLLRAFELFRDNASLLDHYRQRFRHILVDEFQDTNALQYAWLKLLAGDTGSLFAVGDDDQCLAAGTEVAMADGSSKAIESIQAGEQVLSSYGRGEFRSATVTERFKHRRRRPVVNIHLNSGEVIRSTPEHTHFAGYVLGEAPQTYFLYLMYKEGMGYRLGTSQVYTRGQVKPVVGFKQRALHEHADALWIVRTHGTENDARLDEMQTSLRYGLPTLPFVPRKGKAKNGLVHDAEIIGRLYKSLNTKESAEQLLESVGLDPERPHHVPQARNSNRRNIVITLCADRRGASPMHRISIAGVNERDRGELEALGLSIRPAKADTSSWRFETVRRDFGELMRIARRIRERLDNARYVLQGHILDRSLPFITASAIRPGMVMATAAGQFSVVERLEYEQDEVAVYDLNVDRTHNFVASGVVTHNSIYSWRGALVENMQRFQRDFADTQMLRLEQNYRSTATILKAANHLIDNNTGRLGKQLWTDGDEGERIKLYTAYNEQDEARYIVDEIANAKSRGRAYRDLAILYRVSAQSRVIEEGLVQSSIPYRIYGGMKFYERAEIKDALAYLRLALNKDDDGSFERIVNVPTRGIGQRTIQELRDTARQQQISLWRAALYMREHKLLAARALSSLESFLRLIHDLGEEIEQLDLADAVEAAINRSGLIPHFKKEKGERGIARLENLDELVRAAREFRMPEDSEDEMTPLQQFLANAALEAGEAQGDANSDCVQLMTLHAAKGLEFPLVFMIGMEEGLFPHQRSSGDATQLEEERRLCYVGITRAQEQLTLCHAEHRRLHGSDFYAPASRFLRELPEELLEPVRLGGFAAQPLASRGSSGANKTTRPTASIREETGFTLGQRVRHAKFGEGTVLNLEGSGSQTRLQVNFEHGGSKWLVAAYAPLETV
ncbi:DNA helicase-2/ATP-dependent DNA helicase PcrA [Methylohalomonas lacus]|uniref:DNA 3'-5' helicase n=1 Tax=Methylohalomonas lacus TaxID=398773 RepID=A0AAE3HLJ4_9GAMM|nr:3'-5' exonuclease [Methylohalomonas lacus]MCS3903202.1 DNA helicase-2/ATP-dependent DNA helicase PcrA [Methylohalomonas lacus]